MNRDEAIIGNLLDRIRSRFKADPNWGVYDGMLCRSDLEVLLDIISALESDKINNTMNLEHLTADLAAQTAENLALIAKMGEQAGQLAAMTAERDKLREQIDREEHEFEALVTQREKERDAAQRRAEAAERDMAFACGSQPSASSDCSICDICAHKRDDGSCAKQCFMNAMAAMNRWEWRGPQEDKPDATKEASHENE